MTGTSFSRLLFCIISVPLIAGIIVVYRHGADSEPEDTLKDSELICVLDIDPGGRGDLLLPGYNYLLLKSFADSLHSTVQIRCSYGSGSYTDSLKSGAVDIVVMACHDTVRTDSICYSRPVAQKTVWAIRSDRSGGIREAEEWLATMEDNLEMQNQGSLYMHRFEPRKAAQNGRKFKNISPYDEIIRREASKLGWDWRLLAAVIFKESRFHIEARSGRGACGLMQLMPSVAGKFQVEDILDPEENIRAGAEFLDRLQRRFREEAADADELIKFTLAAYNAGAGRIKDCISYTRHIGGDTSTWDGIVEAIPGMRDESVLEVETVKLGCFQGNETIAYVSGVLSLYDAFCAICPR